MIRRRKALLRHIVLPFITLKRDVVRAFSEVTSRDTVHCILAHRSPSGDPLRECANDGDEDDEAKVGGNFAIVVSEVEANSAVDDANKNNCWPEVAMDFAEEGGGLGLLVGAVVEEAESGLNKDEEGNCNSKALMDRVELRMFLFLDGDVDAKGKANEDADECAALPDKVEPEGQAEWELD